MIKCSQCSGPVPEYGGCLLNEDGDFTCSENCKKQYERDRDYFFKHIVHDDTKFHNWLLGD